MTNANDLFQEIIDYRTDEKHRLRGDFGQTEIRERDNLQDHLAQRLRHYFATATLPEGESMFDTLKSEDDYFTQIARDELHQRLGVPRKPKVVTWETKAPPNATGLDDD